MGLVELQLALSNHINNLRGLYRLLDTDFFVNEYEKLVNNEKEYINKLIKEYNRIELEKWIRKRKDNSSDLNELSTMRLRTRAKNLGIPYYKTLNKERLKREIITYEKARFAKESTITT